MAGSQTFSVNVTMPSVCGGGLKATLLFFSVLYLETGVRSRISRLVPCVDCIHVSE